MMRSHRSMRGGLAVLAGLTIAGFSAHQASAAETKSWVVSWFTMAAWSQDGDCPDGLNPDIETALLKNFKDLGMTKDQIDYIFNNFNSGTPTIPEVRDAIINRGRINGKPVNIYANPTSEPDPHIHTVQGRLALGFNLDGKGADSPNSFEDPETHEKGIDNQYFRATGCIKSHRALPPERSLQGGGFQWDTVRSSMPAWLISVTGEDLSKDGDVTVTFDRAIEHAGLDANSNVRANATFRVDPDPRSHNVFRAKMKDGLLTSVEAVDFKMLGDPYYVPLFDFKQAKLRLKVLPNGAMEGVLGGYEPWMTIYWENANGGIALECCVGVDMPGLYYALRRLADGYPDAQTGQNTRISAAYRIEAVPAFVAPGAAVAKTAQSR